MRGKREEGFTLIELAVSLGLFALVLTSLALVFDNALSTTGRSRFDQRAKTLAQEKLEEVRSLPFYVSQQTNTGDVDILDRFFPNLGDPPPAGGTAYDSSTQTYRTLESITVADTAVAFTREVAVRFVVPKDNGTLTVKAPPSTYNSDVPGNDRPVSRSVEVAVTVSWIRGGRVRPVVLDTVISDTRQHEPKVEASGSALGAQVSGLTFFDGDTAADVLTEVAAADTTFREVTEATSEASANALEVLERTQDNDPIQSVQPTGDTASASVPNAADGDLQVAPTAFLASGGMTSTNAPVAAIASWGSGSADAAARVSSNHIQNPEGSATSTVGSVFVNARDQGEGTPLTVLQVDSATVAVTQDSTTAQTTVTASVDLGGVRVWAWRDEPPDPAYEGTVIIDSVDLDVNIVAGSASASTAVSWQVTNLRVWDPELTPVLDENGEVVDFIGGYGPSQTISSASPTAVQIPGAYFDAGGTSLDIVVGASVTESSGDASLGISEALAVQKNVLTITTRDDIGEAPRLEPMVVTLGDISANASYVRHEHQASL